VTPSPIVAEAVFQNREEIKVHPLYYDPIHDFGFFRFDPKSLKFMVAEEVPLAPEAAAVGLDIRVVGNDSGEKISILSGTLARLDRDAPHYSRKGFNDFNTFYLQAASGTKGGSSGSPVVDIKGRAVALNAGGKNKAASAYYLPLNRVVRALNILRSSCISSPSSPSSSSLPRKWQAPVIPRGDLQATFSFKGFDEVLRLGLRSETETQVRAAQTQVSYSTINGITSMTGMLVVDSIVPGGPSDGFLEPGDVLVKLDGQYVSDFLTMEDLLDSKVATLNTTSSSADGELTTAAATVSIEIERGGKPLQATLSIQDLHAVTPSRFLEIGGGSVHNLSYQQARNFRTPVNQLYVAEPGYLLGKAGCPKHCIITAVSGQETRCLDDFIRIVLKLEHGERVPLEYFTFEERNRKKQTILHVDWVWYATPVEWIRDNAEGVFNATTLWPESLVEKETTLGDDSGGGGGAAAAGEKTSSLPSSPKAIASPCIQGTCAGRPPRPPTSTVSTPTQPAAPQKQQQQQHTSSLPLSIPRQHSVPEVATSHPLEKCQAGVTAQGEDARLLVVDQEIEEESKGKEDENNATAATDENNELEVEGEVWRTKLEERLRAAMVAVDVEIPLVGLTDGVHSRAFSGTGIIVYFSPEKEFSLGLVLVDRNTVSIGLGDIMLSLGAYPAEIPAKVRFLHPLHNFALLSFNPAELSPDAAAAVAAVELKPSPPLRRGQAVELVSLSKSLRILHRTSVVTNPAMAVAINQADVPRFRATHEEVIKLDQDFGLAYSGVLCDRQGGIQALWGSYSEQVDKEDTEWTAGLPTAVFQPWIEALIKNLLNSSGGNSSLSAAAAANGAALSPFSPLSLSSDIPVGHPPSVRVLNAELEPLLLSKAAQFGLPSEWISQLMALDKERRQVLRVRSTVAASHARDVLQDGDMVLAVNGKPVSCFGHVERLISELESDGGSRGADSKSLPLPLPLTIFRGGEVLNVSVNLGIEDGLGTDRLVHWAGAQLQAPHRAVLECGFAPKEASGVYISRWHHGSPAHRFGLYALHWIIEVNGEKTPDLDAFLAAVAKLNDADAVRLKIQHYETMRVKVMTLKIDLRYWPTWELRLDAERGEWRRVDV
jgi:S1-C subfamily serine protease